MDNFTLLRIGIATRLKEEREKSGYSKRAFARELDISLESLRKYELGQNRLCAEVLARTALYGVDVQYVLTGVYSTNLESIPRF